MPPSLALFLWFILILALLRFDPAREPGVSWALWVPAIWIFILGSRLPSQWLGSGDTLVSAEAMQEGNALDQVYYIIFVLLAFGILMSRSFDWRRFFVMNVALMALLLFPLLSVLWSDFPFITLKRWFRDLGIYLVILVALSDPRPFEAVRLLLRRVCFVLVSLSILLNKYFIEMVRAYDVWTGQAYSSGVATSKNMFGVLLLVSGLFFFWDTLTRWGDRKERRTRLIIAVNVAFFAMTLWLLITTDSATSRACLVLGCLVVAAAHSKPVKRHPALLTVLVPVGICLYLFLQFGLGIDILASVAETVGRDPTLTDRTGIWSVVLSTNTNPLVGAGYETFWLGPRLQWVWKTFPGINEAHNGYLEVYVNLGLIGLFLLAGFLFATYRTVSRRLWPFSSLGSLGLGLWTILLFYNVTESAFLKPQLIWAVFLLAAITVPARSRRFSPAGPYEFSVRDSAYRQRGSTSAPSPGLARVLR